MDAHFDASQDRRCCRQARSLTRQKVKWRSDARKRQCGAESASAENRCEARSGGGARDFRSVVRGLEYLPPRRWTRGLHASTRRLPCTVGTAYIRRLRRRPDRDLRIAIIVLSPWHPLHVVQPLHRDVGGQSKRVTRHFFFFSTTSSSHLNGGWSPARLWRARNRRVGRFVSDRRHRCFITWRHGVDAICELELPLLRLCIYLIFRPSVSHGP